MILLIVLSYFSEESHVSKVSNFSLVFMDRCQTSRWFFLDTDSLKLRGENVINNIRNGRSHLPVLESDLDLFMFDSKV